MLASERLLEIEEKFDATFKRIGELSTPQTYRSAKKYATIRGDSFGRGYESHSKKDLAAPVKSATPFQ